MVEPLRIASKQISSSKGRSKKTAHRVLQNDGIQKTRFPMSSIKDRRSPPAQATVEVQQDIAPRHRFRFYDEYLVQRKTQRDSTVR
jgi:endoglucanase Acf2